MSNNAINEEMKKEEVTQKARFNKFTKCNNITDCLKIIRAEDLNGIIQEKNCNNEFMHLIKIAAFISYAFVDGRLNETNLASAEIVFMNTLKNIKEISANKIRNEYLMIKQDLQTKNFENILAKYNGLAEVIVLNNLLTRDTSGIKENERSLLKKEETLKVVKFRKNNTISHLKSMKDYTINEQNLTNDYNRAIIIGECASSLDENLKKRIVSQQLYSYDLAALIDAKIGYLYNTSYNKVIDPSEENNFQTTKVEYADNQKKDLIISKSFKLGVKNINDSSERPEINLDCSFKIKLILDKEKKIIDAIPIKANIEIPGVVRLFSEESSQKNLRIPVFYKEVVQSLQYNLTDTLRHWIYSEQNISNSVTKEERESLQAKIEVLYQNFYDKTNLLNEKISKYIEDFLTKYSAENKAEYRIIDSFLTMLSLYSEQKISENQDKFYTILETIIEKPNLITEDLYNQMTAKDINIDQISTTINSIEQQIKIQEESHKKTFIDAMIISALQMENEYKNISINKRKLEEKDKDKDKDKDTSPLTQSRIIQQKIFAEKNDEQELSIEFSGDKPQELLQEYLNNIDISDLEDNQSHLLHIPTDDPDKLGKFILIYKDNKKTEIKEWEPSAEDYLAAVGNDPNKFEENIKKAILSPPLSQSATLSK